MSYRLQANILRLIRVHIKNPKGIAGPKPPLVIAEEKLQPFCRLNPAHIHFSMTGSV